MQEVSGSSPLSSTVFRACVRRKVTISSHLEPARYVPWRGRIQGLTACVACKVGCRSILTTLQPGQAATIADGLTLTAVLERSRLKPPSPRVRCPRAHPGQRGGAIRCRPYMALTAASRRSSRAGYSTAAVAVGSLPSCWSTPVPSKGPAYLIAAMRVFTKSDSPA
jgi:hypothetical protein